MQGMNINEIIEQQAEAIVRNLKMPEVKTTSLEKEMEKNKKIKKFSTRVFLLIDDVSAESYSSFMNYIIENPKTTKLLREVENWTKDGELIRVIDYMTSES